MTTSATPCGETATGDRLRGPAAVDVEFTVAGDLRVPADVATRFFPSDALVAVLRGDELWLLPLVGPEGGGLLLKQRNSAGDRSALVWEALGGRTVEGRRRAVWDAANGALRVDVR